jgi:hypothetical protein
MGLADHLEVFEQVAGVGGRGGDGLGRVDGAPTAKANNQFAAVLLAEAVPCRMFSVVGSPARERSRW